MRKVRKSSKTKGSHREHYSGLEGSPANEGNGSDLDSDLELGDDDIPVTGFAVASNKEECGFP